LFFQTGSGEMRTSPISSPKTMAAASAVRKVYTEFRLPDVGDGLRNRFIQTELEYGLTSATIALLAYHLGESERASLALSRAEDAHGEVTRALAQLPSDEQDGHISAQARELTDLLKEISSERPVFGPDLCQPSMS
jgi:hypothetical protein